MLVNKKLLTSFLLFFMLAGTVNIVHAELIHDQGVCHVCLHIHANDFADIAESPNQDLIVEHGFAPLLGWQSVFNGASHSHHELIRGPPQLS